MTQDDIRTTCSESGIQPSEMLRIVPVDPETPISGHNLAVVTSKARTVLVKIWRHCKDPGTYRAVLTKESLCMGDT